MFYIVFIIGGVFALINEKRITPKIYAIAIVALAGLRYSIGPDYDAYNRIYQKMNLSFVQEIINPTGKYEPGFRILVTACKNLHLPYQAFLAVAAAITIFFIYKAAMKYSENPNLAILVYYSCYFVFWAMSALRQAFALSIVLYYFLVAVEEEKPWKMIVATVIAMLFHYSALFMLVLYFLSMLKLNRKQLIIATAIGILLSLIPYVSLIYKLADLLNNPPVFNRVFDYLGSDFTIKNLLDFKALGRIVFMGIAFVFFDVYCKDNEKNKQIMNAYIFSFIIYFILNFSELMAARLAIYGKFLDIIILTNILYLIPNKKVKIMYAVGLGMLLFAYLVKDLHSVEQLMGNYDSVKYFTIYKHIFMK